MKTTIAKTKTWIILENKVELRSENKKTQHWKIGEGRQETTGPVQVVPYVTPGAVS